jgi:hypothetical protein
MLPDGVEDPAPVPERPARQYAAIGDRLVDVDDLRLRGSALPPEDVGVDQDVYHRPPPDTQRQSPSSPPPR